MDKNLWQLQEKTKLLQFFESMNNKEFYERYNKRHRELRTNRELIYESYNLNSQQFEKFKLKHYEKHCIYQIQNGQQVENFTLTDANNQKRVTQQEVEKIGNYAQHYKEKDQALKQIKTIINE